MISVAQIVGPEGRKIVAHAVSRGLVIVFESSPVGAKENLCAQFLSPLRGLIGLNRKPTACAVSYSLTPLLGLY